MNNTVYLNELKKLVDAMKYANNTPMSIYAKVTTLVVMNLRYENIAFNKDIEEHPFVLTRDIISDAINQFNNFLDLQKFENPDSGSFKLKTKSNILEKKHKELWQEIWSRHNDNEFNEFVDMKYNRLVINDLGKYINNKKCVDFGTGNGSFAFALMKAGADEVLGIDFGIKQIDYATKISKFKKMNDKVKFREAQVFDTGLDSDKYDFAVSNGVFHHLSEKNMEKAVKEVSRVLKNSGWFWYYIDGEGAISMDLWDNSVDILKDVNTLLIEKILKNLNLSRNKMVHVMDGLSASYRHSSYEEAIEMLEKYGFKNFKRLIGGEHTDFDLDVVTTDPYGKEKFGCGDLRILCQLRK